MGLDDAVDARRLKRSMRSDRQWARTGIVRFLLLAAAGILAGGIPLAAQDRVTYIPAEAESPVIAVGEVLDYTGRELILSTLNGHQHLPSDSVTSIETTYSPSHLQGISQFQQGLTDDAILSFQKAMEQERRRWVQREIRSWLMRCAVRKGDLRGALREFQEIIQTDPQTRFWGIAPLIWSPMAVSESIREEANGQLKSDHPGIQLIAASLLLLDPAYGEAAETQLNYLSRNANPIISNYARAQLWRVTLAGQSVTDDALSSWRSSIEHLKPELRSGPQYLLARGHDARGELRLAAAEALWIPLIYSDHELLASRALYDAAEWLSRSGAIEEAHRLKQGLLVKYPWSREASQVRSERNQPGNSTQPPP